jgi:hypothetical protein
MALRVLLDKSHSLIFLNVVIPEEACVINDYKLDYVYLQFLPECN